VQAEIALPSCPPGYESRPNRGAAVRVITGGCIGTSSISPQ